MGFLQIAENLTSNLALEQKNAKIFEFVSQITLIKAELLKELTEEGKDRDLHFTNCLQALDNATQNLIALTKGEPAKTDVAPAKVEEGGIKPEEKPEPAPEKKVEASYYDVRRVK